MLGTDEASASDCWGVIATHFSQIEKILSSTDVHNQIVFIILSWSMFGKVTESEVRIREREMVQ